jgi:hypothetical protein
MTSLVRTIGVAVLALALMNASAGLCFCHRGPVLPGEAPESGGCCHGPQASSTTALSSPGSCCHIESAESAATPVVAVELAQPAATVTALGDEASALRTAPFVASTLQGSSPPLLALRI